MSYPPCTETKCLKYPICKNQMTINCTELFDSTKEFYQGRTEKCEWQAINRSFPKLIFISDDSGKHTIHSPEGIYKVRLKQALREEGIR